MTMPQTRHYEMKDSGVEWIGKMPTEWKCSRVGNFFYFTSGDTLTSEGMSAGQYVVYGANGIRGYHSDFNLDGKYILLGRVGALCGNVHLVNQKAWVTEHALITHKKCKCIEEFYQYVFKAMNLGQYSKASAQPVISSTTLMMLRFPVPPLSEQTAIAAYLDEKCATIDAIIAEAKASIEEYKSWKASVIFETVTKGLNPNAEMKDSGVEWIGEIPRGWAVERLKAMFSFGKGLPITKEDLVEQGIPVISYGQIHAKFNTGVEVLPQLLRYVDAKWLVSNANSLVSEGDFIFADTSEDMEGCGNCVYVDTLNEGAQLFAGYHTIIFKLKRSKHNKFLAYLFKSDAWRTQLRSRVGGVKLFSISRRMLNLATVILPPQNEQTAIAAYLDSKCAAIDGIILEKEDLIREMENYRRSLIFEVVTGKRRVC